MTLSSELAQEALTDAYGTLYDRLDTASILGHLVSERILTEAEHETIRTRATIYDRNAELLVALKRKNVGEIISFCQILFSKKQVGCGEALLEGRPCALIKLQHKDSLHAPIDYSKTSL